MSRLGAGARVGDKERGASCSDILFDRSFHQYRYIAFDIAILISKNERSMAFGKDKKILLNHNWHATESKSIKISKHPRRG